jgi:hypothetical protein
MSSSDDDFDAYYFILTLSVLDFFYAIRYLCITPKTEFIVASNQHFYFLIVMVGIVQHIVSISVIIYVKIWNGHAYLILIY